MITIAVCVLFLAFYTLYYTSKRASLTYRFGFEKWMRNHPTATKIIGLCLLVVAYFLWIYSIGLVSGSLFFAVALMTIGSLIVILKPLKIIPLKNIVFLFIVLEFLEMYYS
jgi:divalent metal cation (Fe/Co/Zn/Cd) transporter